MQVTVRLENPQVLQWWREAPRRVDRGIARAMTQAGYATRNEIVGRQGLSKYGRHNPLLSRTPSPPGDVPAQVTGKLRTTTRAMPSVRHGFGKYTKEVGPTMFYAIVQDEGMVISAKSQHGMWFSYGGQMYKWMHQVTVPARPFIQPAFDRLIARNEFERIFDAEIARAMQP